MVADEVVPYEHRETRSQQSRVSRAQDGDLQARLELIPLDVVERALAREFRKDAPECSILSYLQKPENGVPPHSAVISVFEELADRSEQTAILSALLFRYVQVKGLWRGGANFKSAEDLVRSLDVGDVVEVNIVSGASAHTRKRVHIRTIDTSWGPDWFTQVLRAFPNSHWVGPEDCPRPILMAIARNARTGASLAQAMEGWRTAMERRTDAGLRRKFNVKGSAATRLMAADVTPMNGDAAGNDGWNSGEGERLRVEVKTMASPTKEFPTPSAAPSATKSRKRKAVDRADRVAGLSKKRGKDTEQHARDPPSAATPIADSSPRPRPNIEDADLEACQGPVLGQFLIRFILRCRSYPFLHYTPAQLAQQCCDSCRALSFETMTLLEHELWRSAKALQRVEHHHHQGKLIPVGQLAEETPPTSPERQSPMLVASSLETDGD